MGTKKEFTECPLCKGVGILRNYEGRAGVDVKCNRCEGKGRIKTGCIQTVEDVHNVNKWG